MTTSFRATDRKNDTVPAMVERGISRKLRKSMRSWFEKKRKKRLFTKPTRRENGHCRRSLISSKERQIYDQIGGSRVNKMGSSDIDNYMFVFCEKWNIIWLEATNKSASWYREPMIRGVVVKGYCSVQEIAKRWGISVRWVNQYALDGRIPGAERLGRSWAIPEDAVKPEKHRSGPKPKDMAERSVRKD